MIDDAHKLAFIGAGNMATSIIGGLIAQGYSSARITVSDPHPASLLKLQKSTSIQTASDNLAAVAGADVIVLAVKPQVMKAVVRELGPDLEQTNPVLISIAAGITVSSIQSWLGWPAAVVRCMPNTPALLQMGATVMFASQEVVPAQKDLAQAILEAVGIARWTAAEAQLDAVTALSGSGPAYFFLLIEAMAKVGIELGLEPELSNELAISTAFGASQMAVQGGSTLAELRRRVTSPGGTTAAAIDSFEAGDFQGLVNTAMTAARDRAATMAEELG
ncbi:MAG: pyrroline-5-carboxylate reductase [Halieaceae bacterium]